MSATRPLLSAGNRRSTHCAPRSRVAGCAAPQALCEDGHFGKRLLHAHVRIARDHRQTDLVGRRGRHRDLAAVTPVHLDQIAPRGGTKMLPESEARSFAAPGLQARPGSQARLQAIGADDPAAPHFAAVAEQSAGAGQRYAAAPVNHRAKRRRRVRPAWRAAWCGEPQGRRLAGIALRWKVRCGRREIECRETEWLRRGRIARRACARQPRHRASILRRKLCLSEAGAESATVACKPFRRAAIAAARPAGPPPTMKTSALPGFEAHWSFSSS